MGFIFYPILTEKASTLSEDNNCYSFVVGKDLNKIQIKNYVESKFNVSVTAVRTVNVRADRNAKYTKNGVVVSVKSAYKKAYVQVAEGDLIDLYNKL